MKLLVGLVLVGCGLGIVAIQVFGDPASWAATIPGDPKQVGLVAIATLALVVGGMVLTPAGAQLPPLELPEPPALRERPISEPLPVLSLDEDEEAARRRARRAKRRRQRERGEASPKSKAKAKSTSAETSATPKAKRKRRPAGERKRSASDVAERPRKKKPRKRALAASGRL